MLGTIWAPFTFSDSVTGTAAVPLLAPCQWQMILFLYLPAPGDCMTSVVALLPLITYYFFPVQAVL